MIKKFLSPPAAKVLGKKSIVHSVPSCLRQETIIEIGNIQKDKSLSSEERKRKKREIIAKYRDDYYIAAPNPKVGKALRRYLPQKER